MNKSNDQFISIGDSHSFGDLMKLSLDGLSLYFSLA